MKKNYYKTIVLTAVIGLLCSNVWALSSAAGLQKAGKAIKDTPQVIYASPNGTGDGSSWENAAGFSSAAATARGVIDHQIWLKEGTYLFATSENFDNLFIYGGFNGAEDTLDDRNWALYPTILDGNNAVSPLRNSTTGSDAIPCLLDGVIVQNGLNPSSENGGGMIVFKGAVLQNCIFRNNQTQNAKNGAAVHCHIGTIEIKNCLFINNTSTANGGAVQIGGNATALFTNCTLANNKATGLGGAIGVGTNTSHSTLINTLAYNNLSSSDTSPVYNSYAQNTNINNGGTITSIHSAIESASTKFTDGNDVNHIVLTRDGGSPVLPGFAAPATIIGKSTEQSEIEQIEAASYALANGSICIDAGKTDEVSGISFDLAGKTRVKGTKVDIGAYEFDLDTATLSPDLSAANITVFVSGNELCVLGAKKSEQLNVYSMQGSLIYSQKIGGESDCIRIPLEHRGIYLVNIGIEVIKINY